MSIPQSAVSTTISRGGQAANKMSEAQAPSAYDVWSHSYDGMADRMQSAATNPASILDANAGQLANVASAATDMQGSSLSQVGNSMAAQASALGDSVAAIGQAQGALATVGATFALLTGVEQMLSTALSFIPFPSFPALRIADFDIGLPHAHSHPPNLIPPAPPVPLPSTGPVIPIPILSGATQTLINGMPAARCGDMGLGVWCGGYFPMYEVFLGSSNVWIEGARAARLLVDITKHCMFTTPKPSDPPLGPMIGTSISASPNVLIGGIPMPSLTAIAIGAAMKGLFKLAGKGAKAFARLTAPLRRRLASNLDSGFLKCKILRAEPVNFATGEVVVRQEDYSIPGRIPIAWSRHYGSHSSRKGVCGFGWSSPADARLVIENDGAVLFYDGSGVAKTFPYLPSQSSVQEFVGGATLETVNDMLRVRSDGGRSYLFARSRSQHETQMLVWQIEDRCGNFLRFVRDQNGLREIIESAGRRIEVKSEEGLIRAMWLRHAPNEPAHFLVGYQYSEAAELLAVYDALESPYRFRYEQGRLVQHTDRMGLSFYYAYDADGQSARCHHAWGDGGLYDYRFEFDPTARRVTITNSLGAVSTVQLNELNLPLWEIDPSGGITRYEYDDRGRTTGVTDPLSRRTGYEYDDRGNLLKVIRPDGKCIEAIFNSDDKPVLITDANGSEWKRVWDSHGRLLEDITPLGHVTRYEYDKHGQLVALTNPRGARTELTCDDVGNVTSFKDALGHRTRYSYDTRGNLTGKWDALERKTLYSHDAKGRLTGVHVPSGGTIHCSYDSSDRLTCYEDPSGVRTQFEYFGQGLVKKCFQGDGRYTEYHYDTECRLTGITNPGGQTHTIVRDKAGRAIEEVDYWQQATTYLLDACGDVRQMRDPEGRIIAFERDSLGQLVGKRFTHPTQPGRFLEETFAFDAVGNLIACANEHAKIECRFDADGRLVEERQGDFIVRSTFDPAGNRTRRETSAGNTVVYEFDALDRPVSIQINSEAVVRIERDALGQVRQEFLGKALRRSYAYDNDGQLAAQHLLRGGSQPLLQTEYAYDRACNLVRRHDSRNGVDLYRHDPLGQVVEHIDPQGKLTQFLQNALGDRLSTQVVNNEKEARQWRREGVFEGVGYRFDRAGALVERWTTSASAHPEQASRKVALLWDANQHLVRSDSDGTQTTYGYDPLGRRVFKQTGTRRIWFGWDADTMIAEGQGSSGNGTASNPTECVYYPESCVPLAFLDSTRSVFYYYVEPNGCVTRLLRSDGRIAWEAQYDALGKLTGPSSGEVGNQLRLQGQYEDEETGLRYNRYRYFDAHIGQFISKDPLGIRADTNVYRYGPNVWSWIDPLGLHSVRADLYEPGSRNPRPITNPDLADPDRPGQQSRSWPNDTGSGKAPGSPLGRVGDSEQKLLTELERMHNAGEINLNGSFLDITSEARLGGHTPLPPCDGPGGCREALQRFADKYGMTILYKSDPRARGKSFEIPFRPSC